MAGQVPVDRTRWRPRRSRKSPTTWYPLGYNIRPRRLQTIARESVANYGGQLPSDEETLLSFKGIGAYTAGAIRSFAFRERAAILDTNVARVLFRVFVAKGDPKSHAMKRHLWTLSETLVPVRHVFDFNQALMDFGAMVCVARNPKCLICPMAKGCRAYPFTPESHDHDRRHRGGHRARRRFSSPAQKGVHLEGYWEFPGGKCDAGERSPPASRASCARSSTSRRASATRCFTTTHDYPDRRVELHFLRCELRGEPRAAARSGDALGRARGAGGAGVSAGGRGVDSDAQQSRDGPTDADYGPRR